MKLLVIPRPESHTPQNLEPPDAVLEKALELALPSIPVRAHNLKSTTFRTFTRRGTMFVGKKCNLRCHFCCYLDRVEDPTHPEHEFISLEKAKALCRTLVEVFGRNAVDIQGGEPTIYPHILPLIEYCNEIGLRATLITNALVLDRKERVREFKQAGVSDFLISVQGLGAVYDTVVGMEGAHVRQLRAIRNIAELEIPFRFNAVMTKAVVLHLPQIATLAVRTGARVVNYLMYSPYDDQVTTGTRTVNNVPRYSEVRGPLAEALDILAEAGVEANVRFFPYCMVPERHRKSVYNYAQIQYDHHDWDFASTAWSDAIPQRLSSDDFAEPDLEVSPLGRPRIQLRLGPLRALRRLLPHSTRLDGILDSLEQKLAAAARRIGLRGVLEVSDADAKLKALEYGLSARAAHYRYGPCCQDCDVKEICDGSHFDAATMFGTDEFRPIKLGFRTTDPTFYVGRQEKLVEPEDESWALSSRTLLTEQLQAREERLPKCQSRDANGLAEPVCTPDWAACSVLMPHLAVSVVIPTCRRPQSLLRTLQSLQEQTLPEFEIIVVDNTADSEIEQIIRAFNQDALHPVVYLGHPSGGNRGARHRGVREASGELLVFTDDDATFVPHWLEAHVGAYADNPQLMAAAGPVELAWEAPPPQWLLDYVCSEGAEELPFRHSLFSLMRGRTTFLADDQVVFYSVNMSIRRWALLDVGGFSPEAYGDFWLGDGETGLNRKLWERNYFVDYVPEALVYHHIPSQRMTLEYLRLRSINEGASIAYADFHPNLPSRLRLARHVVRDVTRNLKSWVAAWWCRGRTDDRSLDIQLHAARTQSRLKYVIRLVFVPWLRNLVRRQDPMGED